MIRNAFILVLLCLGCATLGKYSLPVYVDRSVCRFRLKNSQNNFGFFKNPDYEIKVTPATLGCNFVEITIETNASKSLLINIYNMKIGFKGSDVGYWCKYNGKNPDYSIVYTENTKNIVYYKSVSNLDITEGDEIMIYAEDYISCGDKIFSIDTLTFVVM